MTRLCDDGFSEDSRMSCDMSRRVRRRGNEMLDLSSNPVTDDETTVLVDWTRLFNDMVIELFSCLNYRDRASMSLTCQSWRHLGISECLWQSLDLRTHKCDVNSFTSLAPRCANLRRLRFRGAESADALLNLQARGLQDISGDYCGTITDATLSLIAAQHRALESLQLGREFCESISSDAITEVSVCCPKLQRLRLSGIREVGGVAISALARNCPNLTDIGFIDCLNVDVKSVVNILSLRFLSIAGTSNIDWVLVSEYWSNLPNLKCLDVSRTDIIPNAVSRLLLSSESLMILCALHCPAIENDARFVNHKSNKCKLLITLSTNIFEGVASLFTDTTMKERNVFLNWRNSNNNDRNLNENMTWLEWILSDSLLRISETDTSRGLDSFWLNQGVALLLSLIQSSQEDVQERAARAIATFAIVDDVNAIIDSRRSEAVIREGGIPILLQLAKSWREGLQSEATRAIGNLSVNPVAAKTIAEYGGICILVKLTRSMSGLVAEAAVLGVQKLSVFEEHQDAIAEAGAVQALADVIFKWSTGGDQILELAASALANIAADDKGSILVAEVGGLRALVMLARSGKCEAVQEQAARALANLAAPGHSYVDVGQEAGAVEALVQLLRSPHDVVRHEAANALWGISFDDKNLEAIASAGGVEALVAFANSWSNASPGLQEKVSGTLRNLSVSEANSFHHIKILQLLQIERRGNNEDISTSHRSLHSPVTSTDIGHGGVIALLIALAQSEHEYVYENATAALCALAFKSSNALRIVENGGVPVLLHLCPPSISDNTRYNAILALTCIFDSRMDDFVLAKIYSESDSESISIDVLRRLAMKFIEDFIFTSSDLQAFSAAATSSAPALLTQVTESVRILEPGHPSCRELQSWRFTDNELREIWNYLYSCLKYVVFL